MSNYEYNAFTGNLDLVGSGASYINGVVATPASLPTTIGTPALDSVYLAKAGSGVWLVNRRPGGLYCRIANNGNSNDWQHLGAFPEVNADGNWELYNSADPTKELKFDLSGLPTATTRTVNAPDGNGKMLVEGQSIGATTRASGAFTTLNATNGIITASAPVLDLSQTWNNAAVAFTGMRIDCTATANSTSSSYFSINRSGTTHFAIIAANANIPQITIGGPGFATNIRGRTSAGVGLNFDGVVGIATTLQFGVSTTTGSGDVSLVRDAADTLALQRTTNPQTFRLYNTYTDSSNYERSFMRWNSNVFQIGNEAAGTGSNRHCAIVAGANTYTFYNNGEAVSPLSWVANNSGALRFDTRARIASPADSVLRLTNNAATDFDRLQFGGTTSSFPALKRSSTTLQVRLADDTAYTTIDAQHRLQGTAPATSGATGTAGDIRYDGSYFYVCTASNTWVRAALATW